MAITIKELAAAAKVSVATVSRALNDDPKVRPETKKRVKHFADLLDYNPNILARNFKKGTSNIIGLILPDIYGEFFTEIIRGVDAVCYEHGYYPLVASSHSERSMAETMINFMGQGIVGGYIVMAPVLSDDLKSIIQKKNLPIVLINGRMTYEDCDSVGVDNQASAKAMVTHLIEKGYKRIAHISGSKKNNDATRREKGYVAALEEQGIAVDKKMIKSGDFDIVKGEQICREFLSSKNKPDAIFCANDMMAIGCYKAAATMGFKIPEDIAIAGFDDIFVSQFMTPRLTTVRVDTELIGKTAADLLIKRIAESQISSFSKIVIPSTIIDGESS